MSPPVRAAARLAAAAASGRSLLRLLTTSSLARRTAIPVATISSPYSRSMSSAFDSGPAPPRLPPDQQAEFERLVRQAAESAAAASLADAVAAANAKVAETEGLAKQAEDAVAAAASSAATSSPSSTDALSAAQGESSSTAGLNGNPIEGVWRGAAPEFDGERNPKTGEHRGPKNEPLRWGSAGDWSYNGRVTDF